MTNLISIAEAGRRLGIGRTKTYELIKEGRFETVHVGSRHLVLEESLGAFVETLIARGDK